MGDLFTAWSDDVPREADFVCYWHEAARAAIKSGRSRRAGLLATQGVRGGANQKVLKRIKETGDIFEAWQDEPWVVEGAAVRISIVCQDDGSETDRRLDGRPVAVIHPDLTGGAAGSVDLTTARPLAENAGISFMGDTKGGAFDIPGDLAREMLRHANPNGKPNSDVVVPWVNGLDLTRRPRDMFIVDFGVDMSERDASMYEKPFEHALRVVKESREAETSRSTSPTWWRHERPRPEMRNALAGLPRFIVTPRVARHRTFSWLAPQVLPDSATIVFARSDDYAFGVLHSRVHEAWALHQGTQLEDRPRYTPSSTFETFPFPWALNMPAEVLTAEQRTHEAAIAAAARALVEARDRWLNPPELVREEPDVVSDFPPRRIAINDDAAPALAKRTLTRLYNERPAWLAGLHADLDRAVLAAYGWAENITEIELLGNLLLLNAMRTRTK